MNTLTYSEPWWDDPTESAAANDDAYGAANDETVSDEEPASPRECWQRRQLAPSAETASLTAWELAGLVSSVASP